MNRVSMTSAAFLTALIGGGVSAQVLFAHPRQSARQELQDTGESFGVTVVPVGNNVGVDTMCRNLPPNMCSGACRLDQTCTGRASGPGVGESPQRPPAQDGDYDRIYYALLGSARSRGLEATCAAAKVAILDAAPHEIAAFQDFIKTYCP